MKDPIITKLDEIQILLKQSHLAQVGADYMKSITPIDRGNARRHTYASGNEIRADYPYAQRLDDGWSKQRPQGMTEDTVKYLDEYIKKGEQYNRAPGKR